jgi:DNA mismatch endonuclease (patch repair protein)
LNRRTFFNALVVKPRLEKSVPEGISANVVEPLRSRIMASNRSKGNRSTELRLRMALIRAGITGWCLNFRSLPGTPDFWFPEKKLAVFVDGDFWHGNPKSKTIPKTRWEFWHAKIEANRARDIRVSAHLKKLGIIVYRIWESELRSQQELLGIMDRLSDMLKMTVAQRRLQLKSQRRCRAARGRAGTCRPARSRGE